MSPITRRHFAQVAAGLVGSVPALAILPVAAGPTPSVSPVSLPALPAAPEPTEGPFISADAIMQVYRRYILLGCLEANDDVEVWAHPNDTITFTLDRRNRYVRATGPGWEMHAKAGYAPLEVMLWGHPSRAGAYACLMAVTEPFGRT